MDGLRRSGIATQPGRVYEPAGVAVAPPAGAHFGVVPLADLHDPFDRFIVATAAQLHTPLVTADGAIRAADAVEAIW